MRVAVLADIHANLIALEAVLRDVDRQGVDGMIVAGDSTGGPQQQEVIRRLRGLGSWMIRGNGEDYLVAYDTARPNDVWQQSPQWAPLRWFYRQLDREMLDFITSLPEQRVVSMDDTPLIRVVHGSPRDVNEHMIPEGDPLAVRAFRQAGLLGAGVSPKPLGQHLTDVPEPVLVCGHSHIPWLQRLEGQLVLNPGSVGAPINGDPRAQYAVLSWHKGAWSVTPRAIPYDLKRVRSVFRSSGLLEEGGAFALACLRNVETGLNYTGFFVSHVERLAAASGLDPSKTVPDELWARAVESFDWGGIADRVSF
jgi:predicted phosphodiesterase